MRIAIDELSLCALPMGVVTRFELLLDSGPAGPVVVPAAVARGAEGPVVMAVAGVHGDEFEGILALQDVVADLDPRRLGGTLAAFPITNPYAFGAQSRESPPGIDGKNLARVMPGNREGSATERLAARWYDLAVRHLGAGDLFVDLHSAGTRYRYAPMAVYRATGLGTEERARAAAHAFALPNVWRAPADVGPFNSEIARADIPAIGTEIYGQGGARAEDVRAYADGIRRVLRWLDSGGPGAAPAQPRECIGTTVVAPCGGLWRTAVHVGDVVLRGALLGTVHAPSGETLERVLAPRSGSIWIERTFVTVAAGDILVMVAEEDSAAHGR